MKAKEYKAKRKEQEVLQKIRTMENYHPKKNRTMENYHKKREKKKKNSRVPK